MKDLCPIVWISICCLEFVPYRPVSTTCFCLGLGCFAPYCLGFVQRAYVFYINKYYINRSCCFLCSGWDICKQEDVLLLC